MFPQESLCLCEITWRVPQDIG
ncbi:hypothetical protein ACHAXR_011084 [Thalassiosira sp. AJA248-18]